MLSPNHNMAPRPQKWPKLAKKTSNITKKTTALSAVHSISSWGGQHVLYLQLTTLFSLNDPNCSKNVKNNQQKCTFCSGRKTQQLLHCLATNHPTFVNHEKGPNTQTRQT